MMLAIIAALLAAGAAAKDRKVPDNSALDRYIQDAMAGGSAPSGAAPGSTWAPGAQFADLAADLRAGRVDDLVTILVSERASAVARGTLKSSRQSELSSTIPALGGVTRAAGPLASLAGVTTGNKLDGEGATSRATEISTTLAARVTHVLPNGYLVLQGAKDVQVNSERQQITVRGVVRPSDLTAGNVVRSDHMAQLEVRINGKGVVGDAVRRPMFLYRLLLGLLPF